VEHNLDGDISHAVPDFSINGKLSLLHLLVDPVQYQLIRGLLEHNFGEPLEEFQSQLLPHFKDPRPQVMFFILLHKLKFFLLRLLCSKWLMFIKELPAVRMSNFYFCKWPVVVSISLWSLWVLMHPCKCDIRYDVPKLKCKHECEARVLTFQPTVVLSVL